MKIDLNVDVHHLARVEGHGNIVVKVKDGEIKESEGFRYTTTYPYKGPRTYFSGGGGLCSTVEDYFQFGQMLLGGGRLGEHRLLSRKAVELMTNNK